MHRTGLKKVDSPIRRAQAPRHAVHVLPTRVAGRKTCDGARFGFWEASSGGLGGETALSLGRADWDAFFRYASSMEWVALAWGRGAVVGWSAKK